MDGRILGGDAFFYYLAASSKASHSLGSAACDWRHRSS
jgi:hypothetical protein